MKEALDADFGAKLWSGLEIRCSYDTSKFVKFECKEVDHWRRHPRTYSGLAVYRWTKGQQQEDVLTIGNSPPYADLLQSVADELKPQGINVKLVEFSDWHAPNVAVQNGDIDANFFQQSVHLRNAIRETNFDLHSFAPGTVAMSVYILRNINRWMSYHKMPVW